MLDKFVLLADRRSGTTLVIDCLNNLPRVSCEKRAFGIDKKVHNPTPDKHNGMFFQYRAGVWKRRLRFWTDRKRLIGEFLDARIFAPDQSKDIRGFRLIYDKDGQHPEILDYCRETGVKVIHLIRTNFLKTHISFKAAPIHKMHHPRKGDTVNHVLLHLDPSTILAELRQRARRIEHKRDRVAGMPVLDVSYEKFIANRQAEGVRIQRFLGIEDVLPFESDLVKINPDSMADVVENHEEIRGKLEGTEFEEMLY